jgi:Protein RETICULATA-related
MMDPKFSAPNKPQNVLVMSGCYASYMASSSNVRYQVCIRQSM